MQASKAFVKAVPWLRQLVVSLSPLKPGSVHVGNAVYKAALGQIFFLQILRFILSVAVR
jgi:hypothetical protein